MLARPTAYPLISSQPQRELVLAADSALDLRAISLVRFWGTSIVLALTRSHLRIPGNSRTMFLNLACLFEKEACFAFRRFSLRASMAFADGVSVRPVFWTANKFAMKNNCDIERPEFRI